MLPATLFLAQVADKADPAAAFSPQNPAFMVGVVGVILTVFYAVDKIDVFIQRRRRQPSVDVDLVGLQAAIKTLTASVDELKAARADHNGHKERIGALEERCRTLQAKVDENAATHRSHLSKLTREIFERIETLQSSVASNFKEVERGLGKVEGAVEQVVERLNAKS